MQTFLLNLLLIRLVNVWKPACESDMQSGADCMWVMSKRASSLPGQKQLTLISSGCYVHPAQGSCPLMWHTFSITQHGMSCWPTALSAGTTTPSLERRQSLQKASEHPVRDSGVKLYIDASLWRQWPLFIIWCALMSLVHFILLPKRSRSVGSMVCTMPTYVQMALFSLPAYISQEQSGHICLQLCIATLMCGIAPNPGRQVLKLLLVPSMPAPSSPSQASLFMGQTSLLYCRVLMEITVVICCVAYAEGCESLLLTSPDLVFCHSNSCPSMHLPEHARQVQTPLRVELTRVSCCQL